MQLLLKCQKEPCILKRCSFWPALFVYFQLYGLHILSPALSIKKSCGLAFLGENKNMDHDKIA